MQIPVETLFKEGKKFYAIYSGQHDGKAILSGTTQVHQVDLTVVKDFNEGARVYFNDKGEMLEVKKPNTPKREEKTRSSGCSKSIFKGNLAG